MTEPRDWRPTGAPPSAPTPEPGERALPPHLDPRGPRPSAGLTRPSAGLTRSARSTPAATVVPAGSRRARRAARPRRSGGQRAVRLLSWVAVVTSGTVLAASGAGWALLNHYDGQISRIPGITAALPGLVTPPAAPRGAQNVLLVGSDTRDFEGGEAFQGRGDEAVSGQRADTVILAHLYGDSDVAQLVSFPRDAWVTIPAYTDPATGRTTRAQQAKLNAAMAIGGPQLLIATIQELTGIRVDNYVQIDFSGFRSMVDALGGVEVCLSQPAKERDSGIDLPAGRQVVRGDQALAFVRQRKELPRGDLDRIARQQQFIGSLTRKVLSSETLLNPLKLNDFLDVATASVQVDEGLSAGELRDLALRLRSFTAGGVVFSTPPVADIAARREGQSVVLLDEDAAEEFFGALRRDEPPLSEQEARTVAEAAPATPPPPPLLVRPGAVRVQVLNGAGTAGLGRQVSEDLAALGFTLAGPAGDRGSGATRTVVRHGPDKADSAATVAAALPGAVLELDGDLGGTVEVVVGSDYTGAVPVTVGEAPAPAPAPAPSPSSAPGAPGAPPQDAAVVTAAVDVCAV